MNSVWDIKNTLKLETLKRDLKTDVLIVGGGITGLLCAYMLKNSGLNCILVEADRICNGITKNTTAKITVQHGLIYSELINRFGTETAQLYFKAQNEALKKYGQLAKDVDCDFKKCSSLVYSLNDKGKIESELDALMKIGCKATFEDKLPLPFSVAGAVKIKNQAQFHPLKFAYSIAKDLPIFENTKVLEFKPDEVTTNYGTIKAKKIIVATHFPIINKHGGYFLKMYQHRSYVIAFKNVPLLENMYVDESKTGMSFRSYKDLLFVGGGSHRTGKKGGNWNELEKFAKKNYPDAAEVCRWATQDCMTLDGMPYIGMYSKNTPSLYVATGFNKWGMTSAMVSAMLLTDLVQNSRNDYSELFSPSRSIFHPQLAINAGESIMGILTPTTPRCPHMGCALKYNKYEHTWDCSCHGSRFTETGEIINNPATDDMKGAVKKVP